MINNNSGDILDKIVSDITRPRYLEAKSKAHEIWGQMAKQEIPVTLNKIVKFLNIPVVAAEMPSPQIEGFTRTDTNGVGYVIFYNKSSATVRQRFTVAHELGHILMEHLPYIGNSKQISNKSREQEANAFASCLLIPPDHLKKFVNNNDKTLQHILEKYWVSKEVAIIAIDRNRLLNKIISSSLIIHKQTK